MPTDLPTDAAQGSPDAFGLGQADDVDKHIPLRAKRGAGLGTPSSKIKPGSTPRTSRKRKALLSDEPASSPLATKAVKKAKLASKAKGQNLSSGRMTPEDGLDDMVGAESPATGPPEDEDIETAATPATPPQRAPTPTNGSPGAYFLEEDGVPTPPHRSRFGTSIWSNLGLGALSRQPSLSMNTTSPNAFNEAAAPDTPTPDDMHQPDLLTGVGEMDFGGVGAAGQEPTDDEIVEPEPKQARRKQGKWKQPEGPKTTRKLRPRKDTK